MCTRFLPAFGSGTCCRLSGQPAGRAARRTQHQVAPQIGHLHWYPKASVQNPARPFGSAQSIVTMCAVNAMPRTIACDRPHG